MTPRPHTCPRGHRVAPETPVGSCPRCDAIQRAADARIRRVCAWCDPQHPTDGRGPLLPGETVSHGICPVAVAGFLGPVTVLPGASWDADGDGDYCGGFGR